MNINNDSNGQNGKPDIFDWATGKLGNIAELVESGFNVTQEIQNLLFDFEQRAEDLLEEPDPHSFNAWLVNFTRRHIDHEVANIQIRQGQIAEYHSKLEAGADTLWHQIWEHSLQNTKWLLLSNGAIIAASLSAFVQLGEESKIGPTLVFTILLGIIGLVAAGLGSAFLINARGFRARQFETLREVTYPSEKEKKDRTVRKHERIAFVLENISNFFLYGSGIIIVVNLSIGVYKLHVFVTIANGPN